MTVFGDSLVPTVCRALCDPLADVRREAAKTFDRLHGNIGQRVLDDILPHLLRRLVSLRPLMTSVTFPFSATGVQLL